MMTIIWGQKRRLTSSTLMFSFALVSNRLIPICSANFCASVVSTTLELGSSFLFPTENKNILPRWLTRSDLSQKQSSEQSVKCVCSAFNYWLKGRFLSSGTHLIFGTRRHSSGWFHVAIVWRWQRTRHSWRRRPLWPRVFPCSIWTCRHIVLA